ncbi:MAG TPA: CrcB family protein [Egibacteraceae bacterium]|nr:CrcB family protein [Egibacteraceae bacterium]
MRRLGLVAAGGAAGAFVRAVVADVVPRTGGLPLATLLVNLAGAFALGLLLGRVGEDPRHGALPRALIGVGFLGALTTFSALAVELALMPVPAAAGYGLATLAGGLALARTGLRLGRAR